MPGPRSAGDLNAGQCLEHRGQSCAPPRPRALVACATSARHSGSGGGAGGRIPKSGDHHPDLGLHTLLPSQAKTGALKCWGRLRARRALARLATVAELGLGAPRWGSRWLGFGTPPTPEYAWQRPPWDDEVYELWQRRLVVPDAEIDAHLHEIYPERRLDEPRYWRDEGFNRLPQPVVGASWFEARANCAWLLAQMREACHFPTEVEQSPSAALAAVATTAAAEGEAVERPKEWLAAEEPNGHRH